MRLATIQGGSIYYHHNDHLGTPLALTDTNAAVVWSAAYKPFGEAQVDPASTVVNNFRFPGQYYDQETGLHYNWHRYYDPKTGRYLTADPLQEILTIYRNVFYFSSDGIASILNKLPSGFYPSLYTPDIPNIERYLSAVPIGLESGMHLFAYVGNNPINRMDILGLSSQWHFDFAKEGERLIHYGKYRFNQLGQLVEHSGKVIGEACGKAAKALKYLKNVKPDYFLRTPMIIIISPCIIDSSLCQGPPGA